MLGSDFSTHPDGVNVLAGGNRFAHQLGGHVAGEGNHIVHGFHEAGAVAILMIPGDAVIGFVRGEHLVAGNPLVAAGVEVNCDFQSVWICNHTVLSWIGEAWLTVLDVFYER